MKIYKLAKRQKEYREIGKKYWFEYHCLEAHYSADAELWYRSHQKVLVLNIVEKGIGITKQERGEEGAPAVYKIKFDDGFEGACFEDELLDGQDEFDRPNPPLPDRNKQQSKNKSKTNNHSLNMHDGNEDDGW